MMTYELEPENALIHLRASGVLVVSDPVNYFKQLDEDQDFKAKAEERIYFTDLEDIAFSYNDIVQIKSAFEKYAHGEKISHGVFIVDSDLSYGMARMVISIFDDVFDKFKIERISQ